MADQLTLKVSTSPRWWARIIIGNLPRLAWLIHMVGEDRCIGVLVRFGFKVRMKVNG